VATRASIHAERFLRIADPDATSLDLLEGILRWAVTDDEAQGALRRLEHWTRKQLELLGVNPDAALTDDKVLDLLAATRLVTLRIPVENSRALSSGFARRLVALLDGLEPQFLPELLTEVRRRVAGDARFADDIAGWRQSIVVLQARSAALRRDIVQSEKFQSALSSDPPLVMRADEGQAGGIVPVIIIVVVLVVSWLVATHEDRQNK
jgi:hypothetical protein